MSSSSSALQSYLDNEQFARALELATKNDVVFNKLTTCLHLAPNRVYLLRPTQGRAKAALHEWSVHSGCTLQNLIDVLLEAGLSDLVFDHLAVAKTATPVSNANKTETKQQRLPAAAARGASDASVKSRATTTTTDGKLN